MGNEQTINFRKTIDSSSSQSPIIPVIPVPEAPTPTPSTSTAVGFSRSNPAFIGTTVDVQFQYLFKTYYARITILQVVRGDQAWNMLQEANMFNSEAKSGYEYVLVKIRFEYYQGPTSDTQFSLSSISFDAISKIGVKYDYSFTVDPEPSLSTSLYPGATHEGWATYEIALGDSGPLLAFMRNYDGTGGVWFALS